jgi:pimeloyl-ACP methyl ester carboxylesterase
MPFCADLFYRCYINKSEGFVYPVILLHGAGGSQLGWPSNLRRIPDQRVFALDLPGHGHSAQAACRTMRSLVRKLHQFIAEMGFYHVVLVGYSLGGALALSYASAYPEQVAGLLTISCGDRFKIPEEILGLLRKPADLRKAIEIFSQAAFHPSFSPAERRAILAPLSKIEPEVLRADFTIAADFCVDSQSSLPKIPSLIIGGTCDVITPPASLRKLGRCLQKSPVSVFEGAGHMVIYEKNEELRNKVSEFLGKVNKPGYIFL